MSTVLQRRDRAVGGRRSQQFLFVRTFVAERWRCGRCKTWNLVEKSAMFHLLQLRREVPDPYRVREVALSDVPLHVHGHDCQDAAMRVLLVLRAADRWREGGPDEDGGGEKKILGQHQPRVQDEEDMLLLRRSAAKVHEDQLRDQNGLFPPRRGGFRIERGAGAGPAGVHHQESIADLPPHQRRRLANDGVCDPPPKHDFGELVRDGTRLSPERRLHRREPEPWPGRPYVDATGHREDQQPIKKSDGRGGTERAVPDRHASGKYSAVFLQGYEQQGEQAQKRRQNR